jgi:hypothetical protein
MPVLEEREETFFTEGPDELKAARLWILDYALPRCGLAYEMFLFHGLRGPVSQRCAFLLMNHCMQESRKTTSGQAETKAAG